MTTRDCAILPPTAAASRPTKACAQDDSGGLCHPERSEGSLARIRPADLDSPDPFHPIVYPFVSVCANFYCRVCSIQYYPYYYGRIIYRYAVERSVLPDH